MTGEYKRGVEDFRSESRTTTNRRGISLAENNIKMESPRERNRSRSRSRSRSPIRRSRSPRHEDRGRDRNRNRGGGKGTKGKEYRVYVNNMPYSVKWMNLKDLMKKGKFPCIKITNLTF